MKSEQLQLPLLNIFNSLRQRHGLPLGIDEYTTVMRSLQGGMGLESRQDLEQLCCLIWAKSTAENSLIKRLFAQMWQELKLNSAVADKSIEASDTPTNETLFDNLALPTPEINEPVQVVKAVRQNKRSRDLKRPRHLLLTEYFPVTHRQMKQIWRSLRRPVRQGAAVEFDLNGTIEQIGREGFLLEPILIPRKIDRTDLLILLDRDGSMVPFHGLSQQLIETAQQGNKLKQAQVYYFHNCPNQYIYRHPALLEANLINDVVAEMGNRVVVMIVSDAGAARSNFTEGRVKQTKNFIQQLQRSVRQISWLNPMPSNSWQHTSAAEIAEFVPMFEMSLAGMNAAVTGLRKEDSYKS